MATTISLYDVGDVATVSAVFTDANGAAADPTTVTATVTDPAGVTTAYTVTAGQIVKDSVGHYHLNIPVTLIGDYTYVFTGTGAITAAEPGTFTSRPSLQLKPTALTTLGALREYVLRDATDGSQDRTLVRLGNAYSSAVYAYTLREWLPRSTGATRVFAYDGSGFLSLTPYEARTVTGIIFYSDLPTGSQTALTASSATVDGDWRLGPRSATPEGTYLWIDLPMLSRRFSLNEGHGTYIDGDLVMHGYQSLYGSYQVSVTGDWGIAATVAAIPSDVELAVLIAAKDAYENPTGYATGTEGGLAFTEEIDVATGPEARARNLPIESRALLTPYKRNSQVIAA